MKNKFNDKQINFNKILPLAICQQSFNTPKKYGSVKQLRKTPKTKKEQSCKIVVSNNN